MKAQRLLATVIYAIIHLDVFSQGIIKLDTTVFTSEHYEREYLREMPTPTSGTRWALDPGGKLYAIRLSDHANGANREELIGNWRMRSDSIIINIKKSKLPKVDKGAELKFKPIIFKWDKSYNSRNGKSNVNVKVQAVALIDKPIDYLNLLGQLNNLAQEKFGKNKHSAAEEEAINGLFDEAFDMKGLFADFFQQKKIAASIRWYLDGNLQL